MCQCLSSTHSCARAQGSGAADAATKESYQTYPDPHPSALALAQVRNRSIMDCATCTLPTARRPRYYGAPNEPRSGTTRHPKAPYAEDLVWDSWYRLYA
jgi:hypothetical protein